MTIILGAGLSGLIAATQFPNATIYEARDESSIAHRALLRFRSDAVSRLTGIPFRKVTVRKSIWHYGQHVPINMQLANLYSKKTNGSVLGRSIWNLDAVERFIAPEDLIEQMVDSAGSRIRWLCGLGAREITEHSKREPVISTIPMSVMFDLMFQEEPGFTKPDFHHMPIVVDRYRVDACDVHQTIYYPDPALSVYRASITGDILIIERSGALTMGNELGEVLESFGISNARVTVIEESHQQRFGKITPIEDKWRKQFIFDLTNHYNIYSMGRFAIWKNVLLDDVVQDGDVIKRLIHNGTYSASLHNNRIPF